MPTSYTTAGPACNPVLPRPLWRTLNLLLDLSRKHGYAWPTNEWLSERLNYTPRTITRHIGALIRAGYLTAERIANERHIRPAKRTPPDQPQQQPQQAKMSTRCLPASIESKAKENNITQAAETSSNPVVAALVSVGVSAPMAEQLAAKHGEECGRQVEALKAAQGIKDGAAWIVAAIRNAWKHKARKQEAAKPRLIRTVETRPATNTEAADRATWENMPIEQQEAVRKAVEGRLHPSVRHNAAIIMANCLKHVGECSQPSVQKLAQDAYGPRASVGPGDSPSSQTGPPPPSSKVFPVPLDK